MAAIYLYFNAAIYAVFALWCALRPDATAANVGFTALSNGGKSEYLAVYGGLQWGLALIFLILAARPDLQRLGLLLSIALYAPIVLHRAIGLVRYAPGGAMTGALAAFEVLLLLAAVALWFLAAPRPS